MDSIFVHYYYYGVVYIHRKEGHINGHDRERKGSLSFSDKDDRM